MAAAPNRLSRQGWLTKRGRVRKTWKRRWTVLDPKYRTISYYEDNNIRGQKPLGIIELDDVFGIVDSQGCLQDVGKDFCFGLKSKDRTLYMYAENAGEYREWVRLINYVRNNRDGGKGQQAQPQRNSKPKIQRQMPQQTHQVEAFRRETARFATELRRPGQRRVVAQGRGGVHSLTQEFRQMRDQGTRGKGMEAERLKTRLAKLAVTDANKHQTVVQWQKDADVTHCPHCNLKFNMLTFRKNHCRLCGAIVCSTEGCSSMVQMSVMAKHVGMPPSLIKRDDVVRTCITCESHLNDANRQSKLMKPKDTKLELLYKDLLQAQEDAERQLVEFHEAMKIVNKGNPRPHVVENAQRIRQSVMRLLERVNALGTQIERLPSNTKSPLGTQRMKLQSNIRHAQVQWYQPRAFTLHTIAGESAPQHL